MRPIDHLVSRRLLDAFADEELDGARRRRVAAHLGGCRHCRHQLEVTDRIKGHLAWNRVPEWHGRRR